MTLGDELKQQVCKILKERWSEREGRVVPESEDLKLGNDAVTLEGTVLYADLDDSTQLVDIEQPQFAAEIYKCFLSCTAKIIRYEGGEITSYDGDRIMAVFIGNAKNSSATRAALKINFVVKRIINSAIRNAYKPGYAVKHVVGIDTSHLFMARTGIRGANDLVWIGRAANYAAKLSARPGPATQITTQVYGCLPDGLKRSSGRDMWKPEIAKEIGDSKIYTSTWRRRV